MEYIPGKRNVLADCLSRLPNGSIEGCDQESIADYDIFCYTLADSNSSILETEWRDALANDPEITKLINAIHMGWSNEYSLDDSTSKYKHIFDELSVINGLLYRSTCLVVPSTMRTNILALAHEGHIGMRAMKRRIREQFWWPGLDKHVEHFVRDCLQCSISDKSQVTVPSPVEAVSVPSKPWSKLAIDVIGPLTLSSSNIPEYGIVLVDYYTHWPELKFVKTPTTACVVDFLEFLFAREGIPDEIVSDNGSQFTSVEFKNFLSLVDVKHTKTSLYHPRSNGLVERFNRVLKDNIQLSKASNLNCKQELKNLLWAVRTTPNADTNVAPFVLLKGRLPFSKMLRGWMGAELPSDKIKSVDKKKSRGTK